MRERLRARNGWLVSQQPSGAVKAGNTLSVVARLIGDFAIVLRPGEFDAADNTLRSQFGVLRGKANDDTARILLARMQLRARSSGDPAQE